MKLTSYQNQADGSNGDDDANDDNDKGLLALCHMIQVWLCQILFLHPH